MSEFKAGDKVYCPEVSNKVFTLIQHDGYPYSLAIELELRYIGLTPDGYHTRFDILPSIYHATEENKAKLEAFYGIEFEESSVKGVNFKAGDKVYFPRVSNRVLTLISLRHHDLYPLAIECEYGNILLTPNGYYSRFDILPSIYHATPENKAKLEDFCGVEFEAPPVKPASREIIKTRLNKSTKPVPCWVSNDPNCTQPTCKNKWVFIKDCADGRFSKFPYLDTTGNYWMHATLFDPRTNEAITGLPK